jgi:hypothetical protein
MEAVWARAAIGRSVELFDERADSPSIDPWADSSGASAIPCPETDCVRSLLAADVIESAEHRATALGVSADRVLIVGGEVSEETYLRAYAAALGAVFEPLHGIPREFCPLNDQRLIESAAAGMLPLSIDGELYLVVAPRGGATRRIRQLIEENPVRARYFRFTSAECLTRFVLRLAARRSPRAPRGRCNSPGPCFLPGRRAGAPMSLPSQFR